MAKVYTVGKNEPHFPSDFTIVKNNVLQWSDITKNHNKFYSLELHQAEENGKEFFRLFTHYGRTDDLITKGDKSGRFEVRHFKDLAAAKGEYNRLFVEKTEKKGYKPIELTSANVGSDKLRASAGAAPAAPTTTTTPTSSSSSSAPVLTKLDREVAKIVDEIYTEASTTLTNSVAARITARGIETPLGVLTLAQVQKGERLLDQIFALLKHEQLSSADNAALEQLSEQFYSVIPHKLGRTAEAMRAAVIRTPLALEEKQQLVQLMRDLVSLGSALDPVSATSADVSVTDQRYAALRCTLENLTDTYEGRDIAGKVEASQRDMSSMRVRRVFRVVRGSEAEQFTGVVHAHRRLYHGTRASNIVGILSRGLLEPKRIIAAGGQRTNFGWLGGGIYFGDAADTAVKYASAASSGRRFMLVATVALGNIKQLYKITPDLNDAPPGYNSVHGVRNSPRQPSDFEDDEFVVYSREQQRLDYLVEFDVDASDVRAVQSAPVAAPAASTATTSASSSASSASWRSGSSGQPSTMSSSWASKAAPSAPAAAPVKSWTFSSGTSTSTTARKQLTLSSNFNRDESGEYESLRASGDGLLDSEGAEIERAASNVYMGVVIITRTTTTTAAAAAAAAAAAEERSGKNNKVNKRDIMVDCACVCIVDGSSSGSACCSRIENMVIINNNNGSIAKQQQQSNDVVGTARQCQRGDQEHRGRVSSHVRDRSHLV